ncbi:dihydrosphingosine phosphate lyase [Actinidia rufa]|uniref:Dihydrosphingosine phosphate lyase n=1 Tax=Actinidia rufa TaxID=165716 RepID=A0A7J0ENP7_9ERIC|nr:dihydrosphingosine phosphate lyase [Actinidia rufa]
MELSSLSSSLDRFRASANSFLSQYEPLALLLSPILSLIAAWIIQSFLHTLRDKGLKATLLGFFMNSVKLVPGVRNYIDAEKQKVVNQLQSGSKSKRDGWRTELPKAGLGGEVLEKMKDEKRNDVAWKGKCSGTVFAHTNPLHLDVFQSVVRFEVEVVSMTAALLGGKEKASGGQICGNMTSGGTESILLAVKSSRDFMKAKKGITRPEMIIPVSAHSAYDKAAQYFNIKLWRIPVNKEFLADVGAIKRCISKNTVLIVGSAPGFPHGIIDPIEVCDTEYFELGELAFNAGICFHVDLCLGGFVLPFARKLGIKDIPELFIIGRPDMTIVAFGSTIVNVFEVNDILSTKGWHLNALQRPNSIHLCVTLQHVPVVEDFLKDLRDSVQIVKENPGPISGGLAPIYGAAGKMPDRVMVQELLVDFMDSSC